MEAIQDGNNVFILFTSYNITISLVDYLIFKI